MTPVRPEFVPDPSASRGEMEALQRDVRRSALFDDHLRIDPTDPDAVRSALVAGVDQAFIDDDRAVSAVVCLRDGEVVDRVHAVTPLEIPYVPGLLSFREGGPILAAFAELDVEPDVALFDGSGRIHFRQAGIATHVGVTLDLPSVGVAKSLLCGSPAEDVDGRPQGWRTPIYADERVETGFPSDEPADGPANTAARSGADEGCGSPDASGSADASPSTAGGADDGSQTNEKGGDDGPPVIGYAYQSRQYDSSPVVNPLYVSAGHRLSGASAVDVVAALCDGYKLPEPTRLADAYADELKREYA